jgi:hypothetical protein
MLNQWNEKRKRRKIKLLSNELLQGWENFSKIYRNEIRKRRCGVRRSIDIFYFIVSSHPQTHTYPPCVINSHMSGECQTDFFQQSVNLAEE